MSAEAVTPITSIQEPGLQGMPRTYTSQREVPAEFEPPVRGTVVGDILPRFKTHIVLDAQIAPKSGKRVLTLSHCAAPAWTILLGSGDRQDGSGEHLYSQQVVPVPSQSTIEADTFSSYQPIDETKSLKRTKLPRRKKTDGTFEDGYPGKQTKSIGVENLTPQKYRGQTTTVETATVEALSAADVNDIPDPAVPTGDITKITHQKLNDDQYSKTVTSETIDENAEPLAGEEYGDIVTKNVSESLVDEGDAADTGIDVISSVVEPLGNGKAIKQTKRVKSPGWPNPVDKEVSKEGADMPPARYRKDLTRTKTTRKIATGAIPSTPSLSGNEVAKAYKKETPDRAEESVTTQSFTLNTSSIDEALDQKPFVTIRSRMTPGTAPVLPTTGNGSSRLVYEAPDGSKIYENTAEVATAREGPAGAEKDVKPYVAITTNKRYSTSNSISTTTGSSNVVFNDGTTMVYEVSEPTSTGRYGPAGEEQQTKPFVKITSTKSYTSTGSVGEGNASSNKIYDDGSTVVYEKTVNTAQAKPYSLIAGKDAKLGYRIEETDVYSTDSTLATKTGKVDVAFDDGATRVYKKTEVRGYLNNVEFDSSVKNTKLFKETVRTNFKTTAVGADNKDWDGRLVFTDGDLQVFRIDETSIQKKATFTYYSVVHADMPSVLKRLDFDAIEMLPNSNGAVRDKICIRPIIEEGYSGLFKAKIEEYYTEDANEAESFEPLIFKPTAINYDGLNFGISIGKTLHEQIVLDDSIGTNDPDYAPLQTLPSSFRTFDATEGHTSVPSGWQPHAIQVDPYKNGFLVKKIYIQYKK